MQGENNVVQSTGRIGDNLINVMQACLQFSDMLMKADPVLLCDGFIILIGILTVLLGTLQEASDVSKSASAKLMRFAAALDLDAKHQRALAQTAIARNMAVGNYGCALSRAWVEMGSL